MREQDVNIRDIAISSISKSLESSKHPKSGKFIKKLTEKDVRLIVDRVRSEIKKEVPIQPQVPQDIDVVTNQTAEPMRDPSQNFINSPVVYRKS